MRIPDHLTCLLRNLYADQEAIVRTRHDTTDWFRIGKGVWQGCILSPCLFNFYAECMLSHQSCPTLWDPVDCSLSGSSVHGILRQEYWIGLPCPPPRNLPNPGIEPMSLSFPALAGRFFTTRATWEALYTEYPMRNAGWITSWNQDCWERYLQPQIYR